MLNRNKINRIRGILSAKIGAQVPKFTPGGSAPYTLDPSHGKGFLSWLKQNDPSVADQIGDLDSIDWNNPTEAQMKLNQFSDRLPDYQKYLEEKSKETSLTDTHKDFSFIQSDAIAKGQQQQQDVLNRIIGENKVDGPDSFLNIGNSTALAASPNKGTSQGVSLNGSPTSTSISPTTNTSTTSVSQYANGLLGKVDPPEIPEPKIDTEAIRKSGEAAANTGKNGFMTKEWADNVLNGIGGGDSQKGEKIANVIGGATDTARKALFANQHAHDSQLTGGMDAAYDAASSALMSFAPVGTVIGGAMKAGAFIGDALQSMGGGTDQMTGMDQVMDSALFSWNLGAINGFAGKKSKEFGLDQDTLSKVGGSYGGTTSQIMDASQKAGKKYGLFSQGARHKANDQINAAARNQYTMQGISNDAFTRKDMVTNMGDYLSNNYAFNVNGGYDQKFMRAAKQGTKLEAFTPILQDPFEVILGEPEQLAEAFMPELTEQTNIAEFKKGGNIKEPEIEVIQVDTNQKSVIPEGALHKNRHHLKDVGVDDSQLTKKGIPVVDTNGEQQAEIELNEIIFTLEITRELEKRYKEFYKEDTPKERKEELTLEAGKLLWHEILYNTDDRTGLINTLKKGGVVKAQEGVQVPDALRVQKPVQITKRIKPAYKEWVKDINPDYLSNYYDLEAAYKYLPFEQLERWKLAVNSKNPDYYMNYQDPNTGEYIYHLGSVAPYGQGEYIFLKKGREENNPELRGEIESYYNGANGLKNTHDLIYDTKEGRYFYRKKVSKHYQGGIISQEDIDQMVKQALINIFIK